MSGAAPLPRAPVMAALVLASLSLAGCEVGPDYHRPAAVTAPAFKELAGWKPAQPRELAPRGDWWSVFDDPELDGLERQVAVSNQTLKEAVAAYDESVAVVGEARSSLFPTATGTLSDTRSSFGAGHGGGVSTTTTTTGTLVSPTVSGGGRAVTTTTYAAEGSADWEIDVWGRIRRTVNSDIASAQASAADVANAELSAQGQLAVDYFELRAADALKALLDSTVADYRRSLAITQNQYEAGVAARSDVINAQTQLQTAVASEINVGVTRAQLEHAIAVLTGHPPADLTIPPGDLATPVPVVPAGLPSALLERRPDIAAAERLMQAQNEQIGVAIATYYPTITLSALLGFEGDPIGSVFNAADRVWSLGASASETLFSGGERPAAVRAARALYDEAVATYRQTVLSAFEQVEDELSTLRILQDQYAAQQDAVRLARQAVDVTLNQYRAGTQAYTAVITAENTLLADEEALLTVQQERLVASVTLIEALGGGWNAGELPKESVIRTANPIFP
jgi:NodT family efflux transporter outer membrane factor (OMF) lipoprotein